MSEKPPEEDDMDPISRAFHRLADSTMEERESGVSVDNAEVDADAEKILKQQAKLLLESFKYLLDHGYIFTGSLGEGVLENVRDILEDKAIEEEEIRKNDWRVELFLTGFFDTKILHPYASIDELLGRLEELSK